MDGRSSRVWRAFGLVAMACLALVAYGAAPRDREAAEKLDAIGRVNAETALYNQQALLARSIEALKPRDPDRINLYLLAVAGDGTQEVFRREVEFVRDELERMFHLQGHTLTLINSRSTVTTVPMATGTSIARALHAIAAQMDPERDILFFFITTHGSRNHVLVLDQLGMDLPGLTPSMLATMLRSSGIRWKVVLVSACYSGGFVEPLHDEHTLVITAARSDRTSFGCADENELTDFGRAYFKEALPSSGSFQDAFRRAEKLVGEWETQDKVPHSRPQMDNPAAIEEHLARWWAQARGGR